jgi:hypothetical protein
VVDIELESLGQREDQRRKIREMQNMRILQQMNRKDNRKTKHMNEGGITSITSDYGSWGQTQGKNMSCCNLKSSG